MPNYCHCGRSEMMPYCDGSHDGRDRAPRAAEPATPPNPPPASAAAPSPPAPSPAEGGAWRRFLRRLRGATTP